MKYQEVARIKATGSLAPLQRDSVVGNSTMVTDVPMHKFQCLGYNMLKIMEPKIGKEHYSFICRHASSFSPYYIIMYK